MMLSIFPYVVLFSFLFSCSSDSTSAKTSEETDLPSTDSPITTTTTSIRSYYINPQSTDSNIDQYLNEHHVFMPDSNFKNQLLLFLPGTGATPGHYDRFDSLSAKLGFHVIGLSYINRPSLSDLCSESNDQNCYENTRLEIIDGTDRSDKVDINRANSIENRLLKLLAYLQQEHPLENWSQFYTAETVVWSKIIVAGHSQGGGHAGVIAKHNAVKRVIFFNSPSDNMKAFDSPAPWIGSDNQTATKNYYAFFHDQNNGSQRLSVYTLFGMIALGSEVNSDDVSSPYKNSHVIFTNFSTSDDPHNVIIVDDYIPSQADGKPIVKAIWDYLLLHENE